MYLCNLYNYQQQKYFQVMKLIWIFTVLTTRNRSAINQAVSSFKSLITKGRYETAHKYGRIAIGSFMYCRGAQLMHWQDAISKSCQICTKWHPLSEVIETF